MTDVGPDAAETGDDGTTEPARVDSAAASVHVTDPSDAFQALGNEVRMGILETLLAHLDDESAASRVSFSTLFESASVDTTAGFAYHIDELVGPFLTKNADGYAMTYAGRTVARSIESGTYTRRVERSAVALDDPCPFCEADGLEASATDNVVTIACRNCDRPVLRMDFPPTGFEAHGDDLPAAFDRHHRHRIALLGDGVCPECSGRVDSAVAVVRPERIHEDVLHDEESPDPVQAAFACRQCGYDLQCPVALTLLEHPDVVSFYSDHDDSVRECPIWNVGREWTETPLSHDPVAVRIAVTLDDETLECYVDEACTVVGTRRVNDDESAARAGSSDEEVVSAESDDGTASPGNDDEGVTAAGSDETVQASETAAESETAPEADVA